MSKMIQIRNVPDRLHKRLSARAALAGMSLSDFLKQELEESSSQLTFEEMRIHLEKMSPVEIGESAAVVIRAMRGE